VNVLRVLACVVLMMLSAASVQSLPFIGKVTYLSLWQRDAEEGVTALMRAARDGERENVKALLEQGVDVNVRDPGGWSALTYAAAKGDLEIVKVLLSKGAEIDPKDQTEPTPLMAAVTYKNVAVVKMLIAHGAHVNQTDRTGGSAFAEALRSHQVGMVDILRKAGAVEPPPPVNRSSPTPEISAESRPVLLNVPHPTYTMKARDEHIEGIVHARVLVDSDGTVKKVKIITGLPYGMSYQAMDAAYQLRFRPARKNGEPVAYWLPVDIEFHLRR
jgi:TonB family protein